MQLDPHADPQTGGYSVEGIYFETLERDVYRRTAGYSRKKYRIRRYSQGSNVFLERKSKRKGLVTKRRLQLKPSDLAAILNGTYNGTWSLSVAEHSNESSGPTEMNWFLKRIDRLKLQPTLCIAYDRVAFLQMENQGPIRLTIDRGLECCLLNQSHFPCKSDYQSILEGKCIVELKYREALPTVFQEFIEKFKLMSQPVSKFRNAIAEAEFVTPLDCVSSKGIR